MHQREGSGMSTREICISLAGMGSMVNKSKQLDIIVQEQLEDSFEAWHELVDLGDQVFAGASR